MGAANEGAVAGGIQVPVGGCVRRGDRELLTRLAERFSAGLRLQYVPTSAWGARGSDVDSRTRVVLFRIPEEVGRQILSGEDAKGRRLMAKFETVPIGELKHRLPAKLLPLVEEYR